MGGGKVQKWICTQSLKGTQCIESLVQCTGRQSDVGKHLTVVSVDGSSHGKVMEHEKLAKSDGIL